MTTLQILPGSSVIFGGRSVIVKPIPAVTLGAMKFPNAPQSLKMACGGNPKQHFGSLGRAPNSRQGEFAIMRGAFLVAQDYRDRRQEAEPRRGDRGGGARGRGGPPHVLENETLAGVLDGKIPVHIHCYRADDMARMIDLSREFGFKITAFHHASEAYKIAPLLAASGVCIAGWSDWWGFKPEAEDGIRENVAFVDAAGGCAMMHSDISLLGERLNTEAAKAAAAGRRAGLTIPLERAIRWITSNPARALALGDRTGTLAPGFAADVVLWSGDPFSVYSLPDQVYIDGGLAFDRAAVSRPSDFELGRTIVGAAR